MARSVQVLFATLMLACGSDPSPPDEADLGGDSAVGVGCPGGVAPAAEACEWGTTWARCGGTGDEPVFACRHSCAWFEGGCVAEGYVATTCPADDVCCRDGFPYPPLDPSGTPTDMAVVNFFEGYGSEPWTRVRERNVSVTVGSVEPGELTMSCDGDAPNRGPCEDCGRSLMLRRLGDDAFVATVRTSCVAVLFWTLSIEVTRDADDSMHARVCQVGSTDVATRVCRSIDDFCADAGTLAIDAFPSDDAELDALDLELSASFPTGWTVNVSF